MNLNGSVKSGFDRPAAMAPEEFVGDGVPGTVSAVVSFLRRNNLSFETKVISSTLLSWSCATGRTWRASTSTREKIPTGKFYSASRNCVTCLRTCCGEDGTALNISSTGPNGEGNIDFAP